MICILFEYPIVRASQNYPDIFSDIRNIFRFSDSSLDNIVWISDTNMR
jgi:hypothetical protein